MSNSSILNYRYEYACLRSRYLLWTPSLWYRAPLTLKPTSPTASSGSTIISNTLLKAEQGCWCRPVRVDACGGVTGCTIAPLNQRRCSDGSAKADVSVATVTSEIIAVTFITGTVIVAPLLLRVLWVLLCALSRIVVVVAALPVPYAHK